MTSRSVAIIGGGPAGLAAARLIKLEDPEAAVTVYERADSSSGTFGFGVGLTEATMRNMAAADPETADRMREASHAGHALVLRTGDGDVSLHGARNLAIGRAALLEVLTKAALDVGVDIRMGTKVELSEVRADVIVGADGARSAIRDRFQDELGVEIDYGSLHYMWCGADFAVDNAHFTWRSKDDAMFVVHAYPYCADRSTFLIEADAETWEAAGLAANDAAAGPGESDAKSLALLEEVFVDELRGRPLLANRTRWAQFPTVSMRRWSTGNVVLLGDAAHTAHYTIGSGTKLALEDAIALARSLAEHRDVSAAFAAYEAARRPAVERFKHLAARSQGWWSTFRSRAESDPELIALSYMTRAGNIGLADYAREYPENTRVALSPFGDAPVGEPEALDDWILSRPVDAPGLAAPRREVTADDLSGDVRRVEWAGGGASGLAQQSMVDELAAAGPEVVVIGGPDEPKEVGARIDLAERVRWNGATVVVEVPAALCAEAAAAVAVGRVDAVIVGA